MNDNSITVAELDFQVLRMFLFMSRRRTESCTTAWLPYLKPNGVNPILQSAGIATLAKRGHASSCGHASNHCPTDAVTPAIYTITNISWGTAANYKPTP